MNYQEILPDIRLDQSPIRDGAVISIGDPAGCPYPEPAGVAEIRVTGCPASDTLHRLRYGTFDICGHTSTAPPASTSIPVADAAVPPVALKLWVHPDGCQVAPFDGVQATIDRQPLDEPAHWRLGQQLAISASLLELAPYEPPALHAALACQARQRTPQRSAHDHR